MKEQILKEAAQGRSYVGRLAPTPSGFLHRGHASTFGIAFSRAKKMGGKVLLRIEDLDSARCKPEFETATLEDLSWLGLNWDVDECAETDFIRQSDCFQFYRDALHCLIEMGLVYPSLVSRKAIREYVPQVCNLEGEVLFPIAFRTVRPIDDLMIDPLLVNWRFRVSDECEVSFVDQRLGKHSFIAGRDFGDFIIWSKEGYPSYELAVVLDDVRSGITEVVRGEDLLYSTVRQILLYEALGYEVPKFYHCPLVTDENGVRLAKSYDSESIRSYRERGISAEEFWNMQQLD